MAKYTRVESEDKVTKFGAISKTEVDKEIISAMKEGQNKIDELEKENMILQDLVKKLTPYKPKIHPKKMAFINELRSRDTKGVNRTCACCSRRCPIKEMNKGVAEFCDSCRGK